VLSLLLLLFCFLVYIYIYIYLISHIIIKVEELRESVKEVAYRLMDLREEFAAWSGRSAATKNTCADISEISSHLCSVIQKCDSIDESKVDTSMYEDIDNMLTEANSKIQKVLMLEFFFFNCRNYFHSSTFVRH
jgi:hypothetical protein